MHLVRKRFCRLAVAVTIASACFRFGCFSATTNYVAGFNPCGTIINCDPVSYEFLTSGYRGPGADPDIDPACTYPPYCNRTNPGSDPFSSP